MSSNPIHSEHVSTQQVSTDEIAASQLAIQVESEFCQMLLAISASSHTSTESVTYPWNSTSPNADPYLELLDQYAIWEGWDSDELGRQAEALANHCHQLWMTRSLLSQITDCLPTDLLSSIVQRVQATVSANLSLADRLITCVQDVLPNWNSDDLYVIARPLAYAMRGDDNVSMVAIQPGMHWADLSETEQARLALAVARHLIDHDEC